MNLQKAAEAAERRDAMRTTEAMPFWIDDEAPTLVDLPGRPALRPPRRRPCPICGMPNALRQTQSGYACPVCTGEEDE